MINLIIPPLAPRLQGKGNSKQKPRSTLLSRRGFCIKPGDTYFRAGRHYHRPGKLNGCVRDGNRCFLSGMVARKSAGARLGTRPT